MKKLALFSVLSLTLLAVTACENRETSNNPNQQSTKERPGSPNPNPNAPADQNQR